MRPEMLSYDQCLHEPGVYYNPEEGIIIRVSKVSPLLKHSEDLVAGKKGGQPATVCLRIANDPALSDEEIESLIRSKNI